MATGMLAASSRVYHFSEHRVYDSVSAVQHMLCMDTCMICQDQCLCHFQVPVDDRIHSSIYAVETISDGCRTIG